MRSSSVPTQAVRSGASDVYLSQQYLYLWLIPKHVVRATALADQLNLEFALINRKRRRDLAMSMTLPTVPPTPTGSDNGSHSSNEFDPDDSSIVEKMELLVGDVRGKVAILVDDMIDTGHTVRLAAGVLRDNGASEVYALISHGTCPTAIEASTYLS